MNVLIIKNIENEGPGTIEEFLSAEKASWSIVDSGRGGPLPGLNGFTHLVMLGGPMAVYEMDHHPHLKAGAKLLQQAIRAGMPVLGICLGAQMLAHVLGAGVYAGNGEEIGWGRVSVTPEGMRDPLMAALALDGSDSAVVFQWHGDTFDIPGGAVSLASSELFPNQAFRYSHRVYALQFHIEVTPAIVLDWLGSGPSTDLQAVRIESEKVYSSYRARAMNFYRGFFRL